MTLGAVSLSALVGALLLSGCTDKPGAASDVSKPTLSGTATLNQRLSDRHSGYIGDAEAMRRFLACWASETGDSRPEAAASGSPGPREFDGSLPSSARTFHQVRAETGFRSLYERRYPGQARFAEPATLVRFKEASPRDYQNWELAFGDFRVPDDRYYRYDRSQESIFRGADLPAMLVLGAEAGGAFYLLMPQERTQDGEAEVMLLHHGGLIVRFTSFAHLLVHLYLEEREAFAGRDASLGHLYHFPGKLADTCAASIVRLPG